ncbi:MAG TPA: tryptophan--tRNA ligase [Thermodesulfobacteriota bacterium]|nr:tryptophan--tRNA ligase [Thermodesulfobacteriota bacterium]
MMEKRILSGMRPTGRLHLGHYHGVLKNWLELQGSYECFFFVADWHALTTDYADTGSIGENIREMVTDWLSVGIDPARSTIFLQSAVKGHAELFVLLSMITPLPWLERNPTYKEQLQEIRDKDIRTFGFLGYPVLQTSDIIIYRADKVPVGIDQAPHLELSREIARRFNHFYGPVFPEPETLLTRVPKVLGTDGRKMSKSYNNAIFLSDPPEVVEKKMLQMVTDTARKRRTDPGTPEHCPLFQTFHVLYSDPATVEWVRKGCTGATIGCIECKRSVIPRVLEDLEPIRKRRAELEGDPEAAFRVLEEGLPKATEEADRTLEAVRAAMRIDYSRKKGAGGGGGAGGAGKKYEAK